MLHCIAASPSAATDTAAPNVVVLFMDDGGYGDLTCYGHPTIRTPSIDRMAAEGTRFTQFYVASPACSASRYSLLTGRLPNNSGFGWVLMPNATNGIRRDELTLAEALKESGYETACFGKWHLGDSKDHLPLQHGFDKYYGLPYSNDMVPPRWKSLPLMEGNEVVEENPDQSTLTKKYTELAVEFIRDNKEKPFFCYLPYSMPHVPLNPGANFRGKSLRGAYGDVIEEIDWSVGQVLDSLRELGLAENTLVIFTSDNGPWIIKGARGGSSGGLRDGKGSTWEGGVRVPCIAWWPSSVPEGRVCRQVGSTLDVMPTVLSLANSSHASEPVFEGVDLSGVLLGQAESTERPPLLFYGHGSQLHAVRYGPWKLHVRQYSQTGREYFEGKLPLLFNLETDPGEQFDLSGQNMKVVTQLQAIVKSQKRRESLPSAVSFSDLKKSKTQ